MIISKLKQFIIFDCDQSDISISTLLTPEVRNKIFSIEKVSASGLNFRTWNNSLPNFSSLTPNTIYLVTTKPGQVGYDIPGAVDAENYCVEKTTILLNITSDSVTIPSDLKINIFDETFLGATQIDYVGNNNYLISINKPISQNNPFNFIFQIRDERVSFVNINFNLLKKNNYTKTISVGKCKKFLHSDIFSQQSINTIHNWFVDFWNWRENGVSIPNIYFLPENELPPQFNIFHHAINKIIRNNNFQTSAELKNYINNNLQEFKSYSLDKTLFEDFFNKRKFNLIKENFSEQQSLNFVEKQDKSKQIIVTNFLGVSQTAWDCMCQNGLYKTAFPPIPYDSDGNYIDVLELENQYGGSDNWLKTTCYYKDMCEKSFDCRSFSEGMLIYLKNQLKSVCPQASIELFGVPGHAMLRIALGDTSDCCAGYYVLDATDINSGLIYDLTDPEGQRQLYLDCFLDCDSLVYDGGAEYGAIPGNCGPWPIEGEIVPSWEGEPNETGWERSEEETARITGIICDCLEGGLGNQTLNKTEKNLLELCENSSTESPGQNQMYDYFKKYYSYGPNNFNNPSSDDCDLPNTPQAMGCNCEDDSDCEESQSCCRQDTNFYTCVPKSDCDLDGSQAFVGIQNV